MKKEIDISPDKKVANVTISVTFRGASKHKEKYITEDVITMIKEMGYTVTDTVKAAMVTNCNPEKCIGNWIFLLENNSPSVIIEEISAPLSEKIEKKVKNKTVKKIET